MSESKEKPILELETGNIAWFHKYAVKKNWRWCAGRIISVGPKVVCIIFRNDNIHFIPIEAIEETTQPDENM